MISKLDFLIYVHSVTRVSSSVTLWMFVYISQPPISRHGGGLAILHKSIYKASPLTVSVYASFESVALSISGPTPTVLAVVYRPPKYCNTFLDEVCEFLTSRCTLWPNIILLGDFNIHVDIASNSLTRYLKVLVSSNIWTFQPFLKATLWTLFAVQVLHLWTVRQLQYPYLIINCFLSVLMLHSLDPLSRSLSCRNRKKISPSAFTVVITDLPYSDHLSSSDDLVSFYHFE